MALGLFAIVCVTLLIFFHEPLPWSDEYGPMPVLPDTYMLGIWFSIVLAIFFISVYAWQISEESRQFVNALGGDRAWCWRASNMLYATRRGLAAAAAHALGTPLSTISVIARELEREIDPNSPHADDIKLLARTGATLPRYPGQSSNELQAEGAPFDQNAAADAAAGGRRTAPAFRHQRRGQDAGEPSPRRWPPATRPFSTASATWWRMPSILRRERVDITADWTADAVTVVIADDGPGFAPEVMSRIGEPYVRSRRLRRMYATGDTGMGLGLFIAKTLLERSGAKLTFVNRNFPERGADGFRSAGPVRSFDFCRSRRA